MVHTFEDGRFASLWCNMNPLPSEHRTLTQAELYEMANRFLRPATVKVAKTIAKRLPKKELPQQSRFVSIPTKPYKITGPFRCASLTETEYPLWDGEAERVGI